MPRFSETVSSLRTYFILGGLLIALLMTDSLSRLVSGVREVTVDRVATVITGYGVAAFFFYIGIAMRRLLAHAPYLVSGVFIVLMSFYVAIAMSALQRGVSPRVIVLPVIVLTIGCYLVKNVERLAAEERAKRIADDRRPESDLVNEDFPESF